jgi:outer membrane protein assembly factor BamB
LLVTIVACWLAGCGDRAVQLPWDTGVFDSAGEVVLANDLSADQGPVEEPCVVRWSVRTVPTGASTHLAVGKWGHVLVAGSGKLVAMHPESGQVQWTWPDNDPLGIVVPRDEALFTPVVGKSDSLIVGAGSGRIIVLNSNGTGRFALDTEGVVRGAVALTADEDFIAVTDLGTVMRVKDADQGKPFVKWTLQGDQRLPEPLSTVQPMIPPSTAGTEESILILTRSGLHCLGSLDGSSCWAGAYLLPEGFETTSNPIMEADGSVLFVAGGQREGLYFVQHDLYRISPSGALAEGFPVRLYDGKTVFVSLGMGQNETILAGSINAGLFSYSLRFGQRVFRYLENFEDVAQPSQGKDGLIYFGTWPHWLYVLGETGERLWVRELKDPTLPLGIGALLHPSSPIILPSGEVLFHSGNFVTSLRCTDAGPAAVSWPRFGGNDRNTGRPGGATP